MSAEKIIEFTQKNKVNYTLYILILLCAILVTGLCFFYINSVQQNDKLLDHEEIRQWQNKLETKLNEDITKLLDNNAKLAPIIQEKIVKEPVYSPSQIELLKLAQDFEILIAMRLNFMTDQEFKNMKDNLTLVDFDNEEQILSNRYHINFETLCQMIINEERNKYFAKRNWENFSILEGYIRKMIIPGSYISNEASELIKALKERNVTETSNLVDRYNYGDTITQNLSQILEIDRVLLKKISYIKKRLGGMDL